MVLEGIKGIRYFVLILCVGALGAAVGADPIATPGKVSPVAEASSDVKAPGESEALPRAEVVRQQEQALKKLAKVNGEANKKQEDDKNESPRIDNQVHIPEPKIVQDSDQQREETGADQAQKKTPPRPTAPPAPSPSNLKKTSLETLKNMNDFKVCSLGHKYNGISELEFLKNSQVSEAKTVMRYSAKTDDKFHCHITIRSNSIEGAHLKCWSGHKANLDLSTFKLKYSLDGGFLFIQERKARLAYVRPITSGKTVKCPSNFTAIRLKRSDKEDVKKNDPGLAGLTF